MDDDVHVDTGQCRFHAPLSLSVDNSLWPTTIEKDVCGQWISKAQKNPRNSKLSELGKALGIKISVDMPIGIAGAAIYTKYIERLVRSKERRKDNQLVIAAIFLDSFLEIEPELISDVIFHDYTEKNIDLPPYFIEEWYASMIVDCLNDVTVKSFNRKKYVPKGKIITMVIPLTLETDEMKLWEKLKGKYDLDDNMLAQHFVVSASLPTEQPKNSLLWRVFFKKE